MILRLKRRENIIPAHKADASKKEDVQIHNTSKRTSK